MEQIYKEIDKKIEESKSILILTHRSQDGDCVGSGLALYEVIKTNFKYKKISLINSDGKIENFSFLPNYEVFEDSFMIEEYDLVITLDIADIKMTGFGNQRKTVFKDKFLINIDHHFSNLNFGDINLVDDSRPSATAVLYDFFDFMGYKINKNAATCLLTGIYTDTGSFIYSNVTNKTFETSSNLISKGGDAHMVDKKFFANNSFEFLKLYSIALNRLSIVDNHAVSFIKKADLQDVGGNYNDLGSIVSRLNELDGIDYVCFLYEKDAGVKGSLRTTRNDLDLTLIAEKFNGSGHKKASGFMIDGEIFLEDGRVFVKNNKGDIIYFT